MAHHDGRTTAANVKFPAIDSGKFCQHTMAPHGRPRYPGCSIYVHDPGAALNTVSLNDLVAERPDLDHRNPAYWLHQTLLAHPHRAAAPGKADVIFIAHYFLKQVRYGFVTRDWKKQLTKKGARGLLTSGLLKRWRMSPSDFVIAPDAKACSEARGWLDAARWVITEPFGPFCPYRHEYDIMAPPPARNGAVAGWPDPTVPREGLPNGRSRRRFLTYVGRIRKAYIQPPMTLLRFRLWSHLRSHPNVTMLAADVPVAVEPYLPPQGAAKQCDACSFRCKQCIALPPSSAGVPLSVGAIAGANFSLSRPEHRSTLADSTFCLVLRGDHEGPGEAFTEALLAGCIPVLIADMPAWPFQRRLDYRKFSFEFHWQKASLPRCLPHQLPGFRHTAARTLYAHSCDVRPSGPAHPRHAHVGGRRSREHSAAPLVSLRVRGGGDAAGAAAGAALLPVPRRSEPSERRPSAGPRPLHAAKHLGLTGERHLAAAPPRGCPHPEGQAAAAARRIELRRTPGGLSEPGGDVRGPPAELVRPGGRCCRSPGVKSEIPTARRGQGRGARARDRD